MGTVEGLPTFAEVRSIVAAASDVVFSDGVCDELLDQWADETVFVLTGRLLSHAHIPH